MVFAGLTGWWLLASRLLPFRALRCGRLSEEMENEGDREKRPKRSEWKREKTGRRRRRKKTRCSGRNCWRRAPNRSITSNSIPLSVVSLLILRSSRSSSIPSSSSSSSSSSSPSTSTRENQSGTLYYTCWKLLISLHCDPLHGANPTPLQRPRLYQIAPTVSPIRT